MASTNAEEGDKETPGWVEPTPGSILDKLCPCGKFRRWNRDRCDCGSKIFWEMEALENRVGLEPCAGYWAEDEEFPKLGNSGTGKCGAEKRFRKIPRGNWKKVEIGTEEEEAKVYAVEKEVGQMCLGFQVADVKKPLISVRRIVEKGNHVSFGPDDQDNYIINKETGSKMMLKPNGKGSYLMEVQFVGGEKTEITVDSGAEENVCPWEWGSQFDTKEADRWMNFRNASGGRIEHWGKRDVFVTSPF